MEEQPHIYGTYAGLNSASYLWQVPGKPVSVRFEFEVIDRVLDEVMRGFGLIPRKSVEVGGILLGSVEQAGADRWLVKVTDFEPIACSHARGLTWLLSDEEVAGFEETVRRHSIAQNRRIYTVGMYRSHGRDDGLGLAAEDLDLYNRYFPEAWAIALLVRPFATRVSMGAVFFREDGQVRSDSSYLEFPFRRRELGGEAAETDWPQSSQARTEDRARVLTAALETPAAPVTMEPVTPAEPVKSSAGSSRWVLVLAAFLFLLLGLIGGFQAATHLRSEISALTDQDPYSMNLSVAPSGDSSLHVRWDRTAPAIQAAVGGTLHIRDGNNEKEVNLEAAQLRNGSVVYRRATNDVTFRLEVAAKTRVSIAETVRYKGE
jgi:hypothetical protein